MAKSGYGVNRASQNYASQGDPKPPASGPNPKANGILRGIVNFFGGSGQGNSQTYKDAQSHGALSGEHPYNAIQQPYIATVYPTKESVKTIFPDVKTPRGPGNYGPDGKDLGEIKDHEKKFYEELRDTMNLIIFHHGTQSGWDFYSTNLPGYENVKWQLYRSTGANVKNIIDKIQKTGEAEDQYIVIDARNANYKMEDAIKTVDDNQDNIQSWNLIEVRIVFNGFVKVWRRR